MIALLLPLAQAIAPQPAAPPAFAPPPERRYVLTQTETRDDGHGVQRFVLVRHVTFTPRPGGYLATIEGVRVDGSGAPGGAGARFDAMLRGTIGRRLRLLLDDAGTVVDVQDRAAEWARHIGAIERALAGRPAARVALALKPLRNMTPAQQIAQLGEAVAPLVATGVVARGAFADRPVSIAGTTPVGAVALTGQERVERRGDGTLALDRTTAGGAITRRESAIVDAATGIARLRTDTSVVTSASGRLTITRRYTID
ncbi:hypothetical protein M9980_02030 [Sphingomonas donggukensis]|uniref:DUF4908 domain-containing protein n=1 Tax=Sphingomonas donggukensis TaxID=2949093 RepID=A0ABY4TWZ2_9SPHN|nr:hypothetical protein [Sphingomonas donggukensis]URW76032.1 hypothetical protein M9980_02030 [Sphingomonas donggukensis]